MGQSLRQNGLFQRGKRRTFQPLPGTTAPMQAKACLTIQTKALIFRRDALHQ